MKLDATAAALIITTLAWLVPPAASDDRITAAPTPYGPADGLIRLNDRWFDARSPAEESWEDHEFFPIQRIDWIYDALDAEPLLDTMVIHIEAQPQASSRIFEIVYDAPRGYLPTQDVPDFIAPPEGFELLMKEVAIISGSGIRRTYVVKPDPPSVYDQLAKCSPDPVREDLSSCRIHVEYPDPRLYLMARVYGPPARMDAFAPMLPKVAARLREIAFCLDVTDEVLAGTWRPSPPPDDPVAALRGCKDEVIG